MIIVLQILLILFAFLTFAQFIALKDTQSRAVYGSFTTIFLMLLIYVCKVVV